MATSQGKEEGETYQKGDAQKEGTYLQETITRIAAGQRLTVPYNSTMDIYQACIEGNLNAVKYILDNHLEDINCQKVSDRTPVMGAASFGHLEVFDYLVSKGCDLSLRDENNDSVLHSACYGGNTDIVKVVLAVRQRDIDVRGRYGFTPVLVATYRGHTEVVKLLVGRGCNVRTVDKNSNNMLHSACVHGHGDTVRYIVKRKLIPVNSRNDNAKTPVMLAAENGHLTIIKFLREHGSDFKLLDYFRRNILHMSCFQKHVPVVNYIVTLNVVNKEDRDQAGKTPLLVTAFWGHVKVFDYLVKKGCNWKATDVYNNNILHLACVGGQVNMADHIIKQNKADIESKGYTGRTPLLTAAGAAHIPVCDVLVRKGSNINAVDDRKSNLLHLAVMSGHAEVVKYVIEQYKVDTESRGLKGQTPLHYASRLGYTEITDLLVRRGSNLNAVDDYSSNILHQACLDGNIRMVKHIVTQYKADLETKGYKGRTALLLAAGKGFLDVVTFLIAKGGNGKAVDFDRNNVMHLACAGGNVGMVRQLTRLRLVSMNDTNKQGYKPIHIAKLHGHGQIINLLNAWK